MTEHSKIERPSQQEETTTATAPPPEGLPTGFQFSENFIAALNIQTDEERTYFSLFYQNGYPPFVVKQTLGDDAKKTYLRFRQRLQRYDDANNTCLWLEHTRFIKWAKRQSSSRRPPHTHHTIQRRKPKSPSPEQNTENARYTLEQQIIRNLSSEILTLVEDLVEKPIHFTDLETKQIATILLEIQNFVISIIPLKKNAQLRKTDRKSVV